MNIDMLRKIITVLFKEPGEVDEESVKKNIFRIRFFTIIEIIIHLFLIFYFQFLVSPYGENQLIWKNGIIALHATMLIIATLVHIIVVLSNKNNYLKKLAFVQYIYFMTILFGVVLIVTVDQLVTTNITPFVIATLAFGGIFYVRPKDAIIIYSVIYLLFYFALPILDLPSNIISTNRVNGFSVIFIGLGIALINWNNHYNDFFQKKEIASQKKQLEELAYYDPLTKIPNRRLLDIEVKKEIENLKRYNTNSSIIILDIDYFKKINDTYGHPAGDVILRDFAQLVKENIRKTDTIARLGGEEFVILLPKTDIDRGNFVAEKIRKMVMKSHFDIGDQKIQVTASFGVAELPRDSENYYQNADRALYKAKENGRNQVQVYRKDIEWIG